MTAEETLKECNNCSDSERCVSGYKKSFQDLIKEVAPDYYIGRGNPNAKILFVGKECSEQNKNAEFEAKYWKEKISKNESVDLTHEKEVGEGHTWNKYQKLHDYIFPTHKGNGKFNFEKRIFTTEMSEIPQGNTKDAVRNSEFKKKLSNRKKKFFKSDFIQDFDIIVLACSNYIKNNDKCREIDEIFKVHYYEKKEYTKYNWFYSHYNDDKTKLVIHTRQLSTNVMSKLLENIGEFIRQHLISINKYNDT